MPRLVPAAGGRYKVILLGEEPDIIKDPVLSANLVRTHSHKSAEKLKKSIDKHLAVRRRQLDKHR